MTVTAPVILHDRLARITSLDSGGHRNIEDGCCAMEAVAYIAGEPWSDHPQCASPVIGVFLCSWNDCLPDADRTRLILPLLPRIVGTRGTDALESRRALMAADWLVRVYTPAWLRLAKLDAHADALAGLPEITSMEQVPSIRRSIEAARKDAAGDPGGIPVVAGYVAWVAGKATGGYAAGYAAEAAAWAIIGYAAQAAARAAALVTVKAAVGVAAVDAGGAAWAALKPTIEHLQLSAVVLVERMIEAKEAA